MEIRSFVGLVLLCWGAQACGGSSSETPMPLAPVPHKGPEPAGKTPSSAAETQPSPAPESTEAPSEPPRELEK